MEGALVQKAKVITWRLLLVILIFLLSLFLFAFIADEMVLEGENHMDILVFQKMRLLVSPAMTRIMLLITFFGSNNFLLPAYVFLVIYFLLFKQTRWLSVDVAAIGISSTIILFSLKSIFKRLRPTDALVKTVNGFSFPSGHSFCSFTFFGLLIYILWNYDIKPALRWTLSVVFFLFACLVALSRVYLHVHYASDVVAGFFLCFLWLGLSFWLIRKYQHKLS